MSYLVIIECELMFQLELQNAFKTIPSILKSPWGEWNGHKTQVNAHMYSSYINKFSLFLLVFIQSKEEDVRFW